MSNDTSIQLVPYSSEYCDQWNQFIASSKNGTFLFDRGFMEYHSDRFEDHSLLFFDEKQVLKAVLPASLNGDILTSHGGLTYGGFVSSIKMKAHEMLACFDALVAYGKEKGFKKLIYKAVPSFYHRYPSDEDLYGLFRHDAALVRRDISTTIQLSNRPALNRGKKSVIKKAQRSGIQVEPCEDLSSFMALLEANLENRYDTAPVHSKDELQLLMGRFPDAIRLFSASLNDEMVAGCVVFDTGQTVHVQYISSNQVGREHRALDLLFETLISDIFSDRSFFDFGISCEQQGRYLNEGLISQKELFGGRATCYDTYELLF